MTTSVLDGGYDLTQLDPWEAYVVADERARAINSELLSTQLSVVVHDNEANEIGEMGDYISTQVTWKRNAVAPATIVLKGNDLWVPYAMACEWTVVPITIEANGYRWSGRVDTCSDDMVNGVNTVTLQLVSDYDWFNHILIFPMYLLPVEVQIPKEAIFVGPAITNIKECIAEQCIRQSGLIGAGLEFLNNILDPPAWLGSLLDFDELAIPIAVVPTNPFTDTSKWTAFTARMDAVSTVVQQTLKDCGLLLTADLWKPGDPQPWEGANLTRAMIVVDVVDKSNVTGLTGTALDGLIGAGVDIVDTILGEILSIVGGASVTDSGSTDATNPYGTGILASLLGLESKPPWVLYEDGPYSGIVESHVTAHHPLAFRVIGGGHSPKWVNKAVDLLLELMLSELLFALGASGISSTLLDGVFDDVFLAFQQIEDEARRIRLGRFGRPEFFTSTGSAAYTLDELVALESALWDSRGYYSYSLTVQNGYPYYFGGDFFGVSYGDFGIGDPVSWIYKGVIYTDYCYEATLLDDRTHRVSLTAKIGDQSAQESPWAMLMRKYTGLSNAVRAASMAQN